MLDARIRVAAMHRDHRPLEFAGAPELALETRLRHRVEDRLRLRDVTAREAIERHVQLRCDVRFPSKSEPAEEVKPTHRKRYRRSERSEPKQVDCEESEADAGGDGLSDETAHPRRRGGRR